MLIYFDFFLQNCYHTQTLTDPTVKHECSPEVTEDPDYWVTYRCLPLLFHERDRYTPTLYIITIIINIVIRNKVAELAEQFKQDKPNNGLWVPNCVYHVSQGK